MEVHFRMEHGVEPLSHCHFSPLRDGSSDGGIKGGEVGEVTSFHANLALLAGKSGEEGARGGGSRN